MNAASFGVGPLAPDSWATLFAGDLAAATAQANSVPLPTELGGVSITLNYGVGEALKVQLSVVTPGQANFLVPAGTPTGMATLTVRNGYGETASVPVEIANVAPGIFTANGDGRGPPAASITRAEPVGPSPSSPSLSSMMPGTDSCTHRSSTHARTTRWP